MVPFFVRADTLYLTAVSISDYHTWSPWRHVQQDGIKLKRLEMNEG